MPFSYNVFQEQSERLLLEPSLLFIMMDLYSVIIILQISVFCLILFFAVMYSVLILFIRRFHHHNNIFILNMCIAIIGTCVYFIIYFAMAYFDLQSLFAPHMCILLYYAYNIANIEIPFAFVAFSIHRFCSMKYHANPFFKTKRWVAICIGCQWTAIFLISLPFILRQNRVSSVLLFRLRQNRLILKDLAI
jgi:hypothetical protein